MEVKRGKNTAKNGACSFKVRHASGALLTVLPLHMASLLLPFERALLSLDAVALSELARDHAASAWAVVLQMGEMVALGRYAEVVEAHGTLSARLGELKDHARTSISRPPRVLLPTICFPLYLLLSFTRF